MKETHVLAFDGGAVAVQGIGPEEAGASVRF